MISINTNYGGLFASKAASQSQKTLDTAMERLSSGMRINYAKDDAAGQAISTRLTAEIEGIAMASRNAADAQSMIDTAEGALQETTSILQRMRELSVQAANDTNKTADRQSIQDEMNQLIEEIDRIGGKTSFNNQNILDGTYIGAKFHIGANFRENLTIGIKDARADALARSATYSSAGDIQVDGGAQNILDNDVVLNGITIRSTVAADDTLSTTLNDASAIAKAAAINDATGFTCIGDR